jgi:hypothetical protein
LAKRGMLALQHFTHQFDRPIGILPLLGCESLAGQFLGIR